MSSTPTDWASDASLAPPSGPAADYTKAVAVAQKREAGRIRYVLVQDVGRWPPPSPMAPRC